MTKKIHKEEKFQVMAQKSKTQERDDSTDGKIAWHKKEIIQLMANIARHEKEPIQKTKRTNSTMAKKEKKELKK